MYKGHKSNFHIYLTSIDMYLRLLTRQVNEAGLVRHMRAALSASGDQPLSAGAWWSTAPPQSAVRGPPVVRGGTGGGPWKEQNKSWNNSYVNVNIITIYFNVQFSFAFF